MSAAKQKDVVITRIFDTPRERVRRFIMHGPDGVDYPNLIVFDEIVKTERIVYTHGSGKEGDPDHFQSTVTFEDRDGKTRVTMRALFATAAERDKTVAEYGAVEGGKQTLARMDAYVAAMQSPYSYRSASMGLSFAA